MPSPRALIATPYRRGVLVLAVLTLCWRAWTVSRWTWFIDDWQFLARSASMPTSSYLIQVHHGHLMPAGFLVTKLITLASPLNFNVVVVLVALVSAVNVVVWGVAFERLTSGSVLALLPLAVLALSPVMLFPLMWWASSVNALPLQLCLASMVISATRWVEHGRRGDLMWLALSFVAGLAFWQKSILLVLPVVVTVISVAPGPVRARLRTAVIPSGLLAVVAVPYLVLYGYLSGRPSQSNNTQTSAQGHSLFGTVHQYVHGFGDMFLPALLGGPWGSLQVLDDPQSAPSRYITRAVLIVCAAGLGWLALRHRQVLWLLLLPVAYAVVSLGVVLFSTRTAMVLDVMTIDRYYLDSIAVAALSAALMIGAARRPGRRRATGPRWVTPVACGVLGTSLIVANVMGAQRIGTHPGRAWVSNMRADLSTGGQHHTVDDPLVLWDAYAPESVTLGVLWAEDAQLSTMLEPFGRRLAVKTPTDDLYFADPSGHLVPVQVSHDIDGAPGPVQDCGYALGPGQTVDVAMSGSLFYWDWAIQVDSFSSEASNLVMTAGTLDPIAISLPSGVQSRKVQVKGAIPDKIVIRSTSESGTICITDVFAGGVGPVS